MIKISIVVPVHNSEKYINRCVESLINQSLKNIEIILVDDASMDSSPDIIREYISCYPNMIRGFFLDKSRHAGGARNVGIINAIGEYVTFVDSDDYIDLKFCERLYSKAQEDDSDVVCCDFYKGKEGRTPKWINSAYIEQMGKLNNVKRKSILMNTGYSCGMIIKRKLFCDNNILYPEGIGCEDYCMRVLLFLYTDKISKVSEPLYTYVVYDSSLSHQRNSKRHYDYGKAVDWLEEQQKKAVYTVEQKEYIYIAMVRCLLQEIKLLLTYFDDVPKKDIYYIGQKTKLYLQNIKHHGIFYVMGYVEELKFVQHLDQDFSEYKKLFDEPLCDEMLYEKLYILYKERIVENLNQSLCKGIPVYLWGAGKKGKSFLHSIPEVNIKAVVDKDSKKWGQELLPGYKIISPEDVCGKDCVIILANRYFFDETQQFLDKNNSKATLFNLEVFISLCSDI